MQISATQYFPGYDPVTGRLTSPILHDNATKVGRSASHLAGTVPAGGIPVGGPVPITIAPGDYSLVPAIFQTPPANTREVYTEIRSFNLATDRKSCGQEGSDPRVPPLFMYPDGLSFVRAGDQLIGVKSPGQVQSANPGTGPAGDFTPSPARSFFDIFVQVSLPPLGSFSGATLGNDQPLLVENSALTSLPPQVVYIHGGSAAIAVKFRTAGSNALTGVTWNVGDVFGYLVLAGHGINFSCDQASVNNFINQVLGTINNPRPELPVPGAPIPTVSEWGLIVLALLLLTAGMIVLRRRRPALAV